MRAIGIDIGGTKIAAAVVEDDGSLVDAERRPTPAGDSEAILETVIALIEELAHRHEVEAVGVVAPGFIDREQSLVYYAPNISWRNQPVRSRLEERLPGFRLAVDNDANAAGWAEFRYGAGRGLRDMTMLTIGTGVGGAIVADGRLLRGGFGSAAEIGHMGLVPDGLPCGCGSRGCLEQYGSGRALLRMANEVADAGGDGAVLAAERARAGVLHGTVVGRLIADGDPGALAALRELGLWIGEACASIAAVLDPELFVLGGGVAAAGELLLEPIREGFTAHLPARGFHPEASFAVAELVNDAGVIGAADLARVRTRADLFASAGD